MLSLYQKHSVLSTGATLSISSPNGTTTLEPLDGTTSVSVTVLLSTEGGDTLGFTLEVCLEDESGTASTSHILSLSFLSKLFLTLIVSLYYVCIFVLTVEGMDYNLPECMTFSTGMGDGDSIEFDITVNPDALIECDESFIIVISEQIKDNVVIDENNDQYSVTIEDQDSKN